MHEGKKNEENHKASRTALSQKGNEVIRFSASHSIAVRYSQPGTYLETGLGATPRPVVPFLVLSRKIGWLPYKIWVRRGLQRHTHASVFFLFSFSPFWLASSSRSLSPTHTHLVVMGSDYLPVVPKSPPNYEEKTTTQKSEI